MSRLRGELVGKHPLQFWELCISCLEQFRVGYHINPKEITSSNYLIRQSFLSPFSPFHSISTTILAVISFVTITQEAYMMRRSLAKSPTGYIQMTDLKHITKFLHSNIPKAAQNTLLCETCFLLWRWKSHSDLRNCWTNCLEILHAYANKLALPRWRCSL